MFDGRVSHGSHDSARPRPSGPPIRQLSVLPSLSSFPQEDKVAALASFWSTQYLCCAVDNTIPYSALLEQARGDLAQEDILEGYPNSKGMEIFRQTSLAYGNLARTIRAHVGVRKVFEILMGHAQRWRPRSADDHLIPDLQGVAVGTAGYVGNARHQDVLRDFQEQQQLVGSPSRRAANDERRTARSYSGSRGGTVRASGLTFSARKHTPR